MAPRCLVWPWKTPPGVRSIQSRPTRITETRKDSTMIPSTDMPFNGIYASIVCPMRNDASLDEPALAEHIESLLSTDGLVGILCSGHAGENFSLTREEKRRVVEIAAATAKDRAILIVGINAESSLEAQVHAADAQRAGADALLVFPPFSWSLSQDDQMAVTHHAMIDEAVHMPMMLYQAGVRAGALAYTPGVLRRLLALPNIVGIKEGSWETSAYEETWRLVKGAAPGVSVMASGDEHLFTCFAIGSDGSQVSLAVLMPEAIVALDRAIRQGDLPAARALHGRLYPLAKAIYGTHPAGHATARLKACLRLLGKLRCDRMRPPIGPLERQELAMLENALREAGLM